MVSSSSRTPFLSSHSSTTHPNNYLTSRHCSAGPYVLTLQVENAISIFCVSDDVLSQCVGRAEIIVPNARRRIYQFFSFSATFPVTDNWSVCGHGIPVPSYASAGSALAALSAVSTIRPSCVFGNKPLRHPISKHPVLRWADSRGIRVPRWMGVRLGSFGKIFVSSPHIQLDLLADWETQFGLPYGSHGSRQPSAEPACLPVGENHVSFLRTSLVFLVIIANAGPV